MKRLNSERGGPVGGPVLVLIHPMGADLRFWDPCCKLWRPRFDCFAMDLPSAGASLDLAGPLTPRRQAEAVAEELRAQGINRLVLVGCAVGAMIAVELAALMPPEALVLTNPGLATEPAAREALAARAAAVRAGGIDAILPDAVSRAFEGRPKDACYHAYVTRFAAQDPVRYARQIEGILDADTHAALAKICCPTLIVVGGNDRLLPARIGREVQTLVAGAELREYPEAAHFIPWQTPDRFAVDVAEWLQTA